MRPAVLSPNGLARGRHEGLTKARAERPVGQAESARDGQRRWAQRASRRGRQQV